MFKFFKYFGDDTCMYVQNKCTEKTIFFYKNTKEVIIVRNPMGNQISVGEAEKFFKNPPLEEYRWHV